jgi:ferredoxin
MAYVVNENCLKCKYTDCVSVCPVDCFHEGEDFLVIDPEVCIDCGVCVAECPVKAIEPENPENIEWLEINAKYSKLWPVITHKQPHRKDAFLYDGMPDKMKTFGIR